MNCPNCQKNVPTPCRNSNDLAGCVRYHDPVTDADVKRDQTTQSMLELVEHFTCQALVSLNDIGIWTLTHPTLTESETLIVRDIGLALADAKRKAQALVGEAEQFNA